MLSGTCSNKNTVKLKHYPNEWNLSTEPRLFLCALHAQEFWAHSRELEPAVKDLKTSYLLFIVSFQVAGILWFFFHFWSAKSTRKRTRFRNISTTWIWRSTQSSFSFDSSFRFIKKWQDRLSVWQNSPVPKKESTSRFHLYMICYKFAHGRLKLQLSKMMV